MAVFAYRALTPAGRPLEGVLDAESPRAAWQTLRARGVYPTTVHPGAAPAAHARRVPTAELAAATREMAALVAGGVPVAEALAAMASGPGTPALADAATRALGRVREGAPLADALAETPGVFPVAYVAVVRAGEAGGALPHVLARLGDDLARSAAIRARLRTALAYPAIMAVTTVGVVAFLVLGVVPELGALFAEAGAPLPLATRALLVAGRALRTTWWLWLAAAGLAAFAVRAWCATPDGRACVDGALLRMPVVGEIARSATSARIARMLGMLLAGGVPADAALPLAAEATGSPRIATALGAVQRAVRDGHPLADALAASGVASALVVRLAATGERTGTLAEVFERAAAEEERRLEDRLATAMALLEPLLVLVLGAAVLTVVLTILVPLLGFDPLEGR